MAIGDLYMPRPSIQLLRKKEEKGFSNQCCDQRGWCLLDNLKIKVYFVIHFFLEFVLVFIY